MSRPGPHPPPPADLHRRTPLIHETAGPWIRFHSVHHEALNVGRAASSRFNDPASEFGVLYAADSFRGAFIETFGRQLDVRSISAASLMSTGVAEVRARRPLRLVDLAASGGAARLGTDARLTSGELSVAQAWSRALWLHPLNADGLYYRLRHDPAQCGCAIFDRAKSVVTSRGEGMLWDRRHRDDLARALDIYNFGLIVE